MWIRRRQYFVDRDVQGALALRVVGYWIACAWGIFCVLAGLPIVATWCFNFADAPAPAEQIYQTWLDFWPAIAASLLLLPFLIRDVIRLSNRFVGPFFRVRTVLRQLAQGQPVTPVSFRKGDFWHEVAEDVNRIAALVGAQNEAGAVATEPPTEVVQQPAQELVEV